MGLAILLRHKLWALTYKGCKNRAASASPTAIGGLATAAVLAAAAIQDTEHACYTSARTHMCHQKIVSVFLAYSVPEGRVASLA